MKSFALALAVAILLAACGVDIGDATKCKSPAETVSSAQPDKNDTAVRLWEQLSGCWTASQEQFAYFTYRDEQPAFLSGRWDDADIFKEGAGAVFDTADEKNDLYNFSVACSSPENDAQLLISTFSVDISGLERDGKIRIKSPDGCWRQYARGGDDCDEAYNSVHDILHVSLNAR